MKCLLITFSALLILSCGQDNAVAPNDTTISFSRDIEPMLNRGCAFPNCHGSYNTQPVGGPLNLSTGASYGQLLGNPPYTGQPSSQFPQLLRVVPGKPDSSLVVAKLEGTGPGSQMPFFGTPLSANQIGIVRQWILEGALRN